MVTTVRIPLAVCLALVPLLTGCSLTPTAPASADRGVALRGTAFGGQQPIVGGLVYLYAAGQGGYGLPSDSLLNSSVLTNNPTSSGQDTNGNYYVVTDAHGNFGINGDYACIPTQQVYVYLVGGTSDGNPADANSAISLLAILGDCPASGNFATATPFVFMDEVSTIAAAYAMAGYATDATDVSSNPSPLALVDVKNAFANAANLADLDTGVARSTTLSGLGAVPHLVINTLANILATCINSTSPSSTGCSTLFNNMLSGGASGSPATDTATAAIYFAHNPYPGAAQMTALYGNITPTPPFSPALTAQPNDFSIAIDFTGSFLLQPNAIAIDAVGNVLIANARSNSIAKLTSAGALATGSPFTGGGLNSPYKIAIASSGNVWVTNNDISSGVSVFTSAGAPLSGSPFFGSLGLADGIGIDGSDNVWLTNSNNSVTVFDKNGTEVVNSPFTDSSLNVPAGIATDAIGNTWIANAGGVSGSTVTVLNSSGVAVPGSPYSGGGLYNPYAIAMDSYDNAWVTDYATDSVTELNSNGNPSVNSPITGGGLHGPDAIALDSAGTAWVSNYASGVTGISANGTVLSSSTGFTSSAMLTSATNSIAVDGGGNVWVAGSSGGNDILTEFIGLAQPVVTPLAANLDITSYYLFPAARP
jgi:streptogramin lyase